MSDDTTYLQWFKNNYQSTIEHNTLQKTKAILYPMFTPMSSKGEITFHDRIGKFNEDDIQEVVSRHQKVQYTEMDHMRRGVQLNNFVDAKVFEENDAIKNMQGSATVEMRATATEVSYGIDRYKDKIALNAFEKDVPTGKDGTVIEKFTPANFASNFLYNADKLEDMSKSSSTRTVFNLKTLRNLKVIFDEAEIPVEGRMIALTARDLDNLLADPKATSVDYTNVKALIDGQIKSFMGFTFVQMNELTTPAYAVSNTERKVYAWTKSAMRSVTGPGLKVRTDRLTDRVSSIQAVTTFSAGATRWWSEGVYVLNVKSEA